MDDRDDERLPRSARVAAGRRDIDTFWSSRAGVWTGGLILLAAAAGVVVSMIGGV